MRSQARTNKKTSSFTSQVKVQSQLKVHFILILPLPNSAELAKTGRFKKQSSSSNASPFLTVLVMQEN